MSNNIRKKLVALESEEIDDSRKQLLEPLAQYISQKLKDGEVPKLNFICTHNSRRSQLAQVMAQIAALHFGIEIKCYSGGTEATAFNHNAIAAISNFGFYIEKSEGDNPMVLVHYNEQNPIKCFSKVYNSNANPQSDFAAVMTCSDADENCPVVNGADARFSLKYNDPKASDGTGNETHVYGERLNQIATEMLFLFQKINFEF
ncbi:MAG: protein-tyrosine-phosphatase [Bacteroidia bacterium]